MVMDVALQGRAFERRRQFEKLSLAKQQQTADIYDFVVKSDVFKSQRVYWSPTNVVCVRGDVLMRKIFQRLSNGLTATTQEHADEFFDALVLSGFASPLRERDAINAKKLEGFADDKGFFVPTDSQLNGRANLNTLNTASVWEVRDGAVQAGTVVKPAKSYAAYAKKRMGYAALDVSCYAVVNEKHKCLYFFESEHALQFSSKMDLSIEATVQFEETLAFGIRVTSTAGSVVFSVESKELQDAWLNSIINAGAQYREAFNLAAETVKSLYDLKDFDMAGKEVSMEKYRGKVVLVVNVSTLCALTPINYPQLAKLDAKYRDQGLEILAFPCNQFAGQEPGTHEEILEFVKKYNCQFQFFEKHDVNGAGARPVFTYLKAQLPGAFGNFIKWNFTKFLVDRNGQPYRRYAPKDGPLSFEEDIKALLEQTQSAL